MIPQAMKEKLAIYPKEVPIFDLNGLILLPGGHLPLQVVEPPYIRLVEHALRYDRYVGVVQSKDKKGPGKKSDTPLFETGCLGKITTFSESDNGSYILVLSGLVRFRLIEELPKNLDFRRVLVSYEPYLHDHLDQEEIHFEREHLLKLLKSYLASNQIQANWDEIQEVSDEKLITSLTMICPFNASEKQALLESPTMAERCRMMTALLEMAFMKHQSISWLKH